MSFDALVAGMDSVVCTTFKAVQTITYTPDGGSASVLDKAIFDNAFISIAAGQAGVTAVQPAIFVRLQDLPTDPEIDDPIINVGGQNYSVTDVQRDSHGGARILLRKA